MGVIFMAILQIWEDMFYNNLNFMMGNCNSSDPNADFEVIIIFFA